EEQRGSSRHDRLQRPAPAHGLPHFNFPAVTSTLPPRASPSRTFVPTFTDVSDQYRYPLTPATSCPSTLTISSPACRPACAAGPPGRTNDTIRRLSSGFRSGSPSRSLYPRSPLASSSATRSAAILIGGS